MVRELTRQSLSRNGWGFSKLSASTDLLGKFVVRNATSIDLLCTLNVLHSHWEDWSPYYAIVFAFEGANTGSVIRFFVKDGTGREKNVDIADNYLGWKFRTIRFINMAGHVSFDWSNIVEYGWEFQVPGIHRIDHIYLLGCPRFLCKFSVRNRGSKDLLVIFNVRRAKDYLTRFVVRGKGSADLPGVATIRNAGSKDLLTQLEVRGRSSIDLLNRFFLRNRGSADLPVSFYSRLWFSVDLLTKMLVRNADSKSLPVQFVVRHSSSEDYLCRLFVKNRSVADLVVRFYVRRPLAFVDLEVSPGRRGES